MYMEEVATTLKSWSIRFKEKAYTEEELTVLSLEYYEDLRDEKIPLSLFMRMVKITRRNSEFFPTMKKILESKNQALAEIEKEVDSKVVGKLLLEDKGEDLIHTPLNCLREKVLSLITKRGLELKTADKFFLLIEACGKKGKSVEEASEALVKASGGVVLKDKAGIPINYWSVT